MQTAPGEISHDQLNGVLLALASIARSDGKQPPPPSLLAALRDRSPEIPQQYGDEGRCIGPTFEWLEVALVAEFVGSFDVAESILGDLLNAVPQSDAPIRGLIWARVGRVARARGDYERAAACYAEARRLDRAKGDAWMAGTAGSAVLAGIAGNFPQLERHCRSILTTKNAPAIRRFSAHQLLSIAYRKKQEYLDAMLHSWQAFDLLDREDERRFDALIVLADIAAEAGDIDAARAGYRSIVGVGVRDRIWVSAQSGLAVLTAGMELRDTGERRDAEQLLMDIEGRLPQIRVPNERVELLMAASVLASALRGPTERAATWLSEALELAGNTRQHEKVFRIEGLQQTALKPRPPVARSRSQELFARLHRLAFRSLDVGAH